MSVTDTLVSIGMPVRNGEQFLGSAIQSVLGQDHGHLELVISDNASHDGTEEICREFARSDRRVRYYRQPENIGLLNNFNTVLDFADGTYFKWLGDDDWLMPTYVSRCVQVLQEDAALVLVTTQQAYVGSDGKPQTKRYDGDRMRSEQPVERFTEMLRLLNESHLLLDPLYGLMRRARVAKIPRVNLLREDETFAARLALTGPFGHVPEVLSYRRAKPFTRPSQLAVRLGVPTWHARVATALQCRELLKGVCEAELNPEERRRAVAAVAAMYLRRQRQTAVHRSRKLMAMARRSR